MPFGKYEGRNISALPRGYLIWLAKNVAMTEPLASEVEKYLEKRTGRHDTVIRKPSKRWHDTRQGIDAQVTLERLHPHLFEGK
jgi:hypothetical protein